MKEKEQCTFRPQLLTKSSTFETKRGGSTEGAETKDIEEFVRRMERARVKKAALLEAKEKGWTLERVM